MYSKRALACLLLFLLVTLPGLAQAQQPKALVKRVDLRYLTSGECQQLLLLPVAQGGLKELLPAGVLGFVGFETGTILVRAKDQQAMDQFDALLATIDTPDVRYAAEVRLVIVSLNCEDADGLLAQRHPVGPPPPLIGADGRQQLRFYFDQWMPQDELIQKLTRLLEAKKATVTSISFPLTNRKPAVVDLRTEGCAAGALWFNDVAVTRDYVSLSAQSLLPTVPTAKTQVSYSHSALQERHYVRFGQAILVLNEASNANKQRQLVFFVPTKFLESIEKVNANLLFKPLY